VQGPDLTVNLDNLVTQSEECHIAAHFHGEGEEYEEYGKTGPSFILPTCMDSLPWKMTPHICVHMHHPGLTTEIEQNRNKSYLFGVSRLIVGIFRRETRANRNP
jgi:hypothetical protein